MDIREYQCFSCKKLNNYSDEMRCSSCGALHNEKGTEQLFSVSFAYLPKNEEITGLHPVNEQQLRMILGLSSVNDTIWIKTLEEGKYEVGVMKYAWEKV